MGRSTKGTPLYSRWLRVLPVKYDNCQPSRTKGLGIQQYQPSELPDITRDRFGLRLDEPVSSMTGPNNTR